MIYPPLYDLMSKVDCRYTLVVETAMRARQLIDGNAPTVDADTTKPVTIAIEEIHEDKVTYERRRG